jgi:outer membrane receptor protein involved in Fe transport
MNFASRKTIGLVLLFLPASLGLAQGLPSGSIGGSVTSVADGQPLPGVTVTLSSPALQGTRRTVTTLAGHYVAPNLPPGEYTVEMRLDGFDTVTRGGVKLGTSQRQDVDVAMSVKAVAANVRVTAETEQVSMTTQSATTLTSTVIDKLPVARTIESVVLLAPGVNPNGAARAITISGGESYENSFNINGIQTQDNYRGTPEPLYIEDAVSEITTLTSGISAEYGRFSGGAVNVLTKAGGNAFSGSIRTTLTNDAWSAKSPAGEEPAQDVSPVYEATLGGPLWKDRVWLFGAGRLFDRTTTDRTAPPTNIDFPINRKETRYEVKLTASPIQSQTLTFSLLHLGRDELGTHWPGFPILDLDSRYDQQASESLFLANYTGTLANWLFGEVSYGRRRLTIEGFGSQYTDLVKGTWIFNQELPSYFNSPFACAVCPDPADRRNSDQGVVKATAFLSTRSLGSHTIVGGVELFKAAGVVNFYQSGSGYGVAATGVLFEEGQLYPVLGPWTVLGFAPVLVPALPDDARTWAGYVNDTWRLSSRLTFNLGLRWDKNDVRDPTGIIQSIDGTLSPRLGVSWDPTGKGLLRVTAGWGRYVSTVSEAHMSWGYAPGMPSNFLYFYDGPAINVDPTVPRVSTADALRKLFQWFGITGPGQFPRTGIDPYAVFYAGVSPQMRGDLKPQKADEVTLGVNGALGKYGSFRVDAVYRTYSDFYALQLDRTTGTVEDPMGNTIDLAYLTSSNGPLERQYLALKTSFEARPARSLSISGSWTWSRTRGNQIGENTTFGAAPVDVLTYPEYRDLAWNAPVGDLPQDVRHRVRLWANWDMTFIPSAFGRFTLSPLFSLDTGLPYGASGPVDTNPYVTNPGYVTPPPSVTYWFTARDAFRTPTVTSLDLALNWSLNVGPVEIFIQPRVVNVFGGSAVISNDLAYIDRGVRTAATGDPDLLPFNPFREKPVEGVHYALSPTFGQAVSPRAYQQPRTFVVSMGARF